MTTTPEVTPVGLGNKASIELSDTDRRKKGLEPSKVEVKAIRERWAVLTNEHLLEQGVQARVDHRSLEEQGIDRVPTMHLGPAVSALERRGVETEVGKRIAWQRAELAQERLERAAELGRIERERAQVEKSILDLSGDMKAARRERQIEKSSAAELLGVRPPKPTLEEIRLQAAQRWREGREQALKIDAQERREAAAIRLEMEATPPGKAREQAERLAALNSGQLKALIEAIRPPPVEPLVDQDRLVAGAKRALEQLRDNASGSGRAASQAEADTRAWRQAHPTQAKQ